MKRLSFADIAEFREGEVFYEEEHGALERFTVSRLPTIMIRHQPEKYGGWTQMEWYGKKRNGEEVNFLMTKELAHYGPYIFRVESGRKKTRP
jgi:hypothetical protein